MFHHHRARRGRQAELPPELLRVGVQFQDGRRATSTDGAPHRFDRDKPPPKPVMSEEGGGGGAGSWQQMYWGLPLPPPAPLQLVHEWPAAGIPVTRKRSTVSSSSMPPAAPRPACRKPTAHAAALGRLTYCSEASRGHPRSRTRGRHSSHFAEGCTLPPERIRTEVIGHQPGGRAPRGPHNRGVNPSSCRNGLTVTGRS